MGMEQVDGFEAFASHFGVEVHTTGGESTVLEDHEHALGCQVEIRWKLIGVPTQEQVTGVRIDRTEHPLHPCIVQFVHHRVTGQGGVVGLEIELEVGGQVVGAEEVAAGGRVAVVLVLGRLFRLRFDQKLPFEADFLGVVDGKVHEVPEVIDFPFHIGVQECHVAFATTPKHIVLPAELFGDFHRGFDLGGRISKDIGIAGRRSSMHKPRVAKHVRRPPEKLDTAFLLMGLERLGDPLEILVRLANVLALGSNVPIVEGIVRDLEFLENFEGDFDPFECIVDRIGPIIPWALGSRRTERVRTASAHRVPIDNTETHMIAHRAPFDHLVGVVETECQGVP